MRHVARGWPICVRRGPPEDTARILGFATVLGDHADYIPDVLDDWLAARDGVVLVAEVGSPDGADNRSTPTGEPSPLVRLWP